MAADLIRTKTDDYRIDDYGGLLETATARLRLLVHSGGFAGEMENFAGTVSERTIRTEVWLEEFARELRERLAGLRRNLAQ